MVNAMDNYHRYSAYHLAIKMHRYCRKLVQDNAFFNTLFEIKYYNYAYIGESFVSYINWTIKDAIKRVYETIYFISRDGYLLKKIADKIIQICGYNVKTK